MFGTAQDGESGHHPAIARCALDDVVKASTFRVELGVVEEVCNSLHICGVIFIIVILNQAVDAISLLCDLQVAFQVEVHVGVFLVHNETFIYNFTDTLLALGSCLAVRLCGVLRLRCLALLGC